MADANAYLAALVAPFSKEALGCQIPDMWSFPTETQVVKCEFNFAADKDGNLDFALTPSLFQTVIMSCPEGGKNTGVNTGGVYVPDFSLVANCAPFGPVETTAAVGIAGVISPEVVQQQFDRYRIVGFGARLRCLVAPLNQSGRLVISTLPSARQALPSVALSAGPPYPYNTAYYEYLGLPTPDRTGYLTTEMINIPESMECMLSDLSLRGGIEWVAKPTSTDGISFLDSFNNVAVGLNTEGEYQTGEVIVEKRAPSTFVTWEVDVEMTNADRGPPFISEYVDGVTVVRVRRNDEKIFEYTAGQSTGAPCTVPFGAEMIRQPPGFSEFPLPCFSMGIGGPQGGSGIGTSGMMLNQYSTGLVTSVGGAYYTFRWHEASGVNPLDALTVVDPDYFSTEGWESLCVRGTGLPPSDGLGRSPVLSLEVIYHVEGCPKVNGATGTFINGGEAPPVIPGLYQAAAQAASQMPYYRRIAESFSGPSASAMFAAVGR